MRIVRGLTGSEYAALRGAAAAYAEGRGDIIDDPTTPESIAEWIRGSQDPRSVAPDAIRQASESLRLGALTRLQTTENDRRVRADAARYRAGRATDGEFCDSDPSGSGAVLVPVPTTWAQIVRLRAEALVE